MQKVTLIGLGGPSSSGKTTVAKSLHALFSNSVLIHLDDFYLPDDQIPYDESKKEYNWDSPGAIDFKKFKEYITNIRNGIIPTKTLESYEPDANLKLSPDEIISFQSEIKHLDTICHETKLVFVDGFMLYHDIDVSELFDIRLFFHASYETLKTRRESRKGYNTVAGFWVDPPNYFDFMVWPAYVESHRQLFKDGDVNKDLNDYAITTMKLLDIKNENLKLADLIQWSISTISSNIQTD